MSRLNWKTVEVNEEDVAGLQQQLKIHPVLCRLLVQRGVTTYEEARTFFRPSLESLHDPFLMKDMDKAVERISHAIASGEKILVYGDYDVDGTTAVATVYSFLRTLTSNLHYYIPNRYTEGYGVSTQGIDYAAAHGFTLIIALDCGVKSVDKVAYAAEKNIDFIICDHHLPGSEIPDAVAVLDPKREDCGYPYKELSGCGIGFKLIQGIAIRLQISMEQCYQYLDLVCVSIGSDIVAITGENRILAYYGLKKLNTQPCPGLAILKQLAAAEKEFTIDDVVFILGPRINAAGRIEDGSHAVKLLIGEEDDDAILEQAAKLNTLNTDRKDLDRTITAQALDMIQSNPAMQMQKSTVVFHPEWHKGVIGIVASRLTETYYRPTVVLTESNGVVTGSARSVKGFNLYEAIYECREHLIQFGGHHFAAGLTMHIDKVNDFMQTFEAVVSKTILPEQLNPELEIDAWLALEDITESFYNILTQMAPFGPGNMKPVFATSNVKDSGWSKVLKEEHLKLSLKTTNGNIVEGIAFSMAEKLALLKEGQVAIAYHLQENNYRDKRSIQLVVKDIRKQQEV